MTLDGSPSKNAAIHTDLLSSIKFFMALPHLSFGHCTALNTRHNYIYNLRNAGNIQNYRVHTNLFSNSFFPFTVRAWNDLPNDIKDAPSVGSLKYKINKNLRSPPKIYNTGTRKGQILQARLRMECSSLNSDLHRKNIVPNPSVGAVSLKVVAISFFFFFFFFLLVRFTHSIDSDTASQS